MTILKDIWLLLFSALTFSKDGCPFQAVALVQKEHRKKSPGKKKPSSNAFGSKIPPGWLWFTCQESKLQSDIYNPDVVVVVSHWVSVSVPGQQAALRTLLTGGSRVADTSEGCRRRLNARPIFANPAAVLSADDFRAVNPWNKDQCSWQGVKNAELWHLNSNKTQRDERERHECRSTKWLEPFKKHCSFLWNSVWIKCEWWVVSHINFKRGINAWLRRKHWNALKF